MKSVPKDVYLQGETIFLRDLLPEDVTADYVEWMNDPDVVQFTESRFVVHTQECIQEFVEQFRVNPAVMLLAIFDNATKLHLGNIKLGAGELASPARRYRNHRRQKAVLGKRRCLAGHCPRA